MVAVTNDLATQHGGMHSKNSVVKFNRPANVTAYGAGDAISDQDSVSTAVNALQFKGVGKSGRLDHALVVMEEDDTVALELWVFDSEPTGQADNAAFTLSARDAERLVGVFSFADADKKDGANIQAYMVTLNAEGTNSHRYATDDGTLWGLLVTRSAYTPISASQFVVSLQVEGDHS